MQKLSNQDVKKQSQAVFGQFGESKWKPFAKEHSKHPNRHDPEELRHCGVGKTLLSIALGASLEGQIETIKKYRDRVDVVCCDKGFKPLLERGIKPDYVMLCDCNVVWQKWAPTEEQTEGVKLLSTPYGNITWTRKWKGPIYFYVNRDAINSQDIFLEIMGPQTRIVPASSNVSNAMVVFFTGLDEWTKQPFACYEKILVVGYDYSWQVGGNYYAWADPKPKRYYMTNKTVIDSYGNICRSSDNLIFSAKWLDQYVKAAKIPVVNCSERGLLEIAKGTLEEELARIDPLKGKHLKTAFESAKRLEDALKSSLKIVAMHKGEYHYGSRGYSQIGR